MQDPPAGPGDPNFDPEIYFAYLDGQVNVVNKNKNVIEAKT